MSNEPTTARAEECGKKHLRWSAVTIGIVIAICGGTWTLCNDMTERLRVEVRLVETRVRAMEQHDAANAARFDAIKESLARIEGRCEENRP